MPQYWIQTPVENAKEVVQRYLDDNSATLSAYAGATISYDEQCEVVLYNNDLTNFSYDFNTIYFGTFVIPISYSTGSLAIDDDNSRITTLDLSSTPSSGQYKSIIWNDNGAGFSSESQIYFIGYKFNITTP